MEAAIAAARRAFDTTAWATDHELPQALHPPAAGGHRDASRRSCGPSSWPRSAARCSPPTARSSTPRSARRLTWPAEMIDAVPVEPRRSARRTPLGMGESEREVWKEPIGVVGGDRAVELPDRDHPQQARPGARHGQHRACSSRRPTRRGTPPASAGSSPSRPTSRPGVVNIVVSSDHLVGEVLTTSPARRHGRLHRLHRHRPADHGGRRGHPEARVPRARRQVDQPRARRRRPRRRHGGRRRRCASTPARAAPCPPACWCPGPATTRRSSWPRRPSPASATATRPTPCNLMGPVVSEKQRERVLGYIESGRAAGRPRRHRRRPARPTSTRAGSSSRRCSSTSTTR